MILSAQINDAEVISVIGKQTFLEAHRSSGPEEDLNIYLGEKFSPGALRAELENPLNIFHVLLIDEKVVGYSKIIFNTETTALPDNKNACKMERLYILADCYGKRLGYKLFDFNRRLALNNGQSGFWLTVWVENQRAIAFYEKLGFKIVGEMLFKVANTYNPNFIMWLGFNE